MIITGCTGILQVVEQSRQGGREGGRQAGRHDGQGKAEQCRSVQGSSRAAEACRW